MTDTQTQYLIQCRDTYDNEFINNIMPFWMKYGLDRENGGVYTCIDRIGKLMDKTKSVWFQGRFGFIAAYAYNNITKDPDWLAASKSAIDFIEKHCIDTDGHMFFTVTADGKPIQKRRYVFSECFAAMAMAEYSKASGDKAYADKALDMFKNILRMTSTPGFLQPKTMEEARGHSLTMMLINVAAVIKQIISSDILDKQVDQSLYDLEHYFMHPEYESILETVGMNGGFIDTCAGRTINPGHCIETSWFVLAEAERRGWDEHIKQMGLTIFNWAWKWGWDEPFGGIINFRDCRNFPPQDYSQDMKFWWPQCEAIIGSLYCYKATKDPHYLYLHKQIHDYAFNIFPDEEYCEWYGYLHRDGTVAQDAKGNIFKGPFHIPRMMIISRNLINEILNK